MTRCNGRRILTLLTLLATTGCNKTEKSSDSSASAKELAPAEVPAEKAVEKAIEADADKAGARFVKGMTKNACEVLTPAMVAKTYDVPEGELKQMKVMGCIYSWKEKKEGETETTLEAHLSLMRTHKTVDSARTWFTNATSNKTGEELQKEMGQVTAKAKEREEIDTKLKKKTVDQMGGLIAESMKGGTTYEPVSGIGDEAKVSKQDGSLWIRVDNLTFKANAYKGPPQPKPKLDMKDLKDIKKLTQQSMQAQADWLEKTHEERKKASIILAKVIIAALP